jgi:hypothetical protein
METTGNKTGKGKRYGIAFVFLLMSLLSVMAETGMAAEARLTLSEAVKSALDNNHELKAQRNAHAAKQADVGIARSYLLPKISLEERYLRTVNQTQPGTDCNGRLCTRLPEPPRGRKRLSDHRLF